MRSAAEAVAYARALHGLVVWLGICDGNMQEGSFRIDANVSVRPKGQKELGTRSEVKNVNSFRFLERAILYEVRRQIELIEDGGKVVQETRLYDSERDETRSMRSKEDAHDYRYFPDPDLPPLVIAPEWVARVQGNDARASRRKSALRFEQDMALSAYDAAQLTVNRASSDYFEELRGPIAFRAGQAGCELGMGELSAALNRDEIEIAQSPIKPAALAALVARIIDGTISNKMARDVFAAMWTGENGGDADAIIDARGLKQISDSGAIEAMIDEVLAANPAIVEEFRAGKQKAFNSLVGQVMKAAKGKANPQQVNDLLKEKLA